MNRISLNNIFLIDACGALLSAVSLLIIFYAFGTVLGILAETVYLLATLPILFAAFGFFCHFFPTQHRITQLKILCFANISYCVLTFSMLFTQNITALGMVYFLLEIVVIAVLVSVEFRIIKHSTHA
jgi:hypothetical protein